MVRFLFGVKILQPITGLADIGNKKGLPTPYLKASVKPFVSQIDAAQADFVNASLFLNNPKFESEFKGFVFCLQSLALKKENKKRKQKNKQTNNILN